MKLYSWNDAAVEQMNPLIARQVLHTPSMTIARIHLKKGAVVPEHAHAAEQVSTIQEGSLRFQVEGREVKVSAGESLVIGSNVPHSAIADEDCVALDVFTPAREDWIRGDDAYLRR